MDLLQKTIDTLGLVFEKSKRPALLWSGGKDSTLLLFLIKNILKKDIDCIQWTLPWMKQKWSFQNKLSQDLNLTVYDSLPNSVALCYGNDRIDFMESYSIGQENLIIARGTEPHEPGNKFVCGVEWLLRPKIENVDFVWDNLICGHKSCDIDPLSGPIPLQLDIQRIPNSADIWFPLKDWSEKDVSDHTLKNNIPFDTNRYEIVDGLIKTKFDKHLNSDYYHTCTNCISKNSPDYVPCPKLNGLVIPNISEAVQTCEPKIPYCGLRTE